MATLKIIPAPGYKFDSWGGDASGTANSINILIDGNKSINVKFVPIGPSSMIKLGNAAASFLGGVLNFFKK
jgi:uncharacterized repeat protein (TIGR02543 family)